MISYLDYFKHFRNWAPPKYMRQFGVDESLHAEIDHYTDQGFNWEGEYAGNVKDSPPSPVKIPLEKENLSSSSSIAQAHEAHPIPVRISDRGLDKPSAGIKRPLVSDEYEWDHDDDGHPASKCKPIS